MSDVPALNPKRRSETEVIVSGDAGTPITVLNLRDEESFAIHDIAAEYVDAGTVGPIQVEIHDASDGDAIGDVDEEDAIDIFEVAAGGRYERDNIAREDIENDVLVVTDRAGDGQDANIIVTIGGFVVAG